MRRGEHTFKIIYIPITILETIIVMIVSSYMVLLKCWVVFEVLFVH